MVEERLTQGGKIHRCDAEGVQMAIQFSTPRSEAPDWFDLLLRPRRVLKPSQFLVKAILAK